MGHGPRYHVKFRRRREGKTDYRLRLSLLRSGKPRLVVRRSNRNVNVQFFLYDEEGDQLAAQADSKELDDLGWSGHTGNTTAAYLTGLLAGTRAREAGLDEAVLDIGRQKPSPGGVLFAALNGAVDAGIDVPHGEGVFPSEDRIRGEHLETSGPDEYATVVENITGASPEGDAAEADETETDDEQEGDE